MDVSVIVPVYNVEKYLDRCIRSLQKQKNLSYEIILIDDGSTDNSWNICDQYQKESDNIIAFHKLNEGLGLTRNYGTARASGEYILYVDSDDYVKEDSISSLVNYMKEKELDIAFFGRSKDSNGIIEEERYIFPENVPNYKILTSMCLGEPLQKDEFEIGPAWKAMYKKSFLNENNLCFESERECLSEDYLFSAKLCLKDPKAGFWNHNIYYYCDNGSSLTNSYNPDRPYKAVKLFEKMKEIILEGQLEDDASLRNYSNFVINLLVSFKHISLNKSFKTKEKIGEIKKICLNEDVRTILNDNIKLDTKKLTLLRGLVLNRCYLLIYALMKFRYKR